MAVCHLSYKKKVCAHLLFFVILQNVIFTKEFTAYLIEVVSYRSIRAFTSTDTSVHIGRSKRSHRSK